MYAKDIELTPRIISVFVRNWFHSDPNKCWLWLGWNNGPNQYGRLKVQGRCYLAHRIAYMVANNLTFLSGKDAAAIRHTCDNRLCVNPSHLIAGSQRANIIDCEYKGRAIHLSNEKHPRCTIPNETVEEIRRLYATDKYFLKDLAFLFNISIAQTCIIVNYKGRR